MALYSVWDWDRNAFAIYRTKTRVSVGDDPLPHRPRRESVIGADPDSGVKPLPSNARLVGYDHIARGEIRRKRGALGQSGDDAGRGGPTSNGWLMFGAGALAASAWWWWKRRGR